MEVLDRAPYLREARQPRNPRVVLSLGVRARAKRRKYNRNSKEE
jgi:hypothetical protein